MSGIFPLEIPASKTDISNELQSTNLNHLKRDGAVNSVLVKAAKSQIILKNIKMS